MSFFMSEHENSPSLDRLEPKSISIKIYDEDADNYYCLVSGYYRISKEDSEETDDGEDFIPYLELPSESAEQLVRVYFKPGLSSSKDLITHIGNSLGYRKSTTISNTEKDNRDKKIYVLNPSSKKCQPILNKILTRKRLSDKERKSITQCYQVNEWKFQKILKLSCSGLLTQSTMITQSSVSIYNDCPVGFSIRKDDSHIGGYGEHGKAPLCMPNRCACENGIEAHSNYDSMKFICGLTSQEVLEDDDYSGVFKVSM